MSTLLSPQTERAQRTKQAQHDIAARDFARASQRVRALKIACMVALGICFWFSVPYHLPLVRPTSLAAAAANASVTDEGSMSRQIAVPLIALIALYMLWRLPKRGRFHGKLMAVSLLYIGWSIASILWSQAPAITGKRLIVFAADALFAFTAARVFSVMEMALWGFATTGAVALVSLYADVSEHVFAPFDPAYRFMGVMEANYQAMSLVVCIVCALTLLQRRPKWMPWIAPCVAFALALLYLTRSRLSAILCFGLVAILFARIAKERLQPQTRTLAIVALLAIALPLLILVVGSVGEGAATGAFMMGRNDTQNTASLSNRAPLWSELMESVERRPWLGFGYEAFWTPERVDNVSLDQGWAVPNAHDTYLDQMLSLGVVGMLLYIAMLWGACVVAWKRHTRERTTESLFAALLLTWLALESLAESVPLDPYLPTMLAYACVAKMCMVQGSEAESDRLRGPQEIVTGLAMDSGEAV